MTAAAVVRNTRRRRISRRKPGPDLVRVRRRFAEENGSDVTLATPRSPSMPGNARPSVTMQGLRTAPNMTLDAQFFDSHPPVV